MKKATNIGGLFHEFFVVPEKRLELPTFALRMRCSTN